MLCFHKNKGAISVFLVLILVPCMLIASIFVDISRVHLSRAVAESSADLALSTLMSNYDYDLSEYYGLMGSCQDIDRYYAVAEEGYDISLHSRDLDNEEIQLLYQRVMNGVGSRFEDETVSDLLRVQNRTQGAMITPLEGANMYNAVILQEQIVEFMKYRGPIVIAQEIIDKIKSGSGVGEMLDSDKNKPIVDNKISFYEAEGELLQKAFDVYWDTRAYTDQVGDNGENMSVGKLQDYAKSLQDYRAAYQEIHTYLVGNLTNTQNLTGPYLRVTMELDVHKDAYDKTSVEIYSRKETPTPAPASSPSPSSAPAAVAAPEPVYYIDGDKVTSLLNNLETAREAFITAKNDFINACGSLPDTPPGAGDSDPHAVQWWVRMDSAVNASAGANYTGELRNKADAMLDAYARVLAIKDCEPGNGMPSGWEAEWEKQVNDTRSVHGQYLVAGVRNDTDKYLKAVTLLEQVSATNADRIHATGLYVTVDGQSRTLEASVSHIQSRLDAMQRDVDTYIGLLDKVIGGSPSEIDDLRSLAQKYSTELNRWDNSVSAVTGLTGSSNLAAEHREEIDGIRATGSEPLVNGSGTSAGTSDEASARICLSIDGAAVDAMKNRLTHIRSQYQVLHDAIEGMRYGSARLLDIGGMSTMKTCSQAAVSADAIGLTNGEVNSYAASTFSQLFAPAQGDIVALHGMEGSADNRSYNPLMSPVTEQIDTPDLYLYMHGKFKDTGRDKVESEKTEQENAKSQAGDAEKDAKDKGRYHGDGTDITPTDRSKGDGFNPGAGLIKGLVGIVKALFTGNVDNIRDDLYATTYMMEMFSYATFENEGYYSIVSDADRESLNLVNHSDIYGKYKGTKQTDKKTWLSADPQDAYNKTLTNRLINRENNAAYLAEVEYILYGKDSNEENVKAAYGDIYAIRYALNLVSAFANFWSVGSGNTTAKGINAIANAIMGATGGVIPAAVTKVILLPILTVFETCKDMDRLEAGFPVELYKQAGDWWYSLPDGGSKISDFMKIFPKGDGNEGSSAGNKDNSGKGLQYSDYLTLFVYLGLQSEDSGSEKMYLRMADVIQANMRKATDGSLKEGDEPYSLANTQVYFRLKAKLRVEPLMLALPYYTEYVDDPSMRDDWCTFEVETIRGY